MAQKIYNNGSDGKILMSSAGKVIRQPYEFGNAFQNRMGLNNYIKISGLNISSLTHSVGMWWNQRNAQLGNKYLINFRSSTNSQYYKISSIASTSDAWAFVKFNTQAQYQGSQSYISALKNSFFIKNGSNYCRHWREGVLTTNEFTSVIDPSQEWLASEIYIGAISDTVGGTLFYNNSESKYHNFTIFDRVVTEQEIKYTVNNLIGSDLQTTSGLYIHLKLDKAEILNTGGSDFVGVRDYSGNNHHGQIMNLPAGTLEYKRDYANTNLFVPFLT